MKLGWKLGRRLGRLGEALVLESAFPQERSLPERCLAPLSARRLHLRGWAGGRQLGIADPVELSFWESASQCWHPKSAMSLDPAAQGDPTSSIPELLYIKFTKEQTLLFAWLSKGDYAFARILLRF